MMMFSCWLMPSYSLSANGVLTSTPNLSRQRLAPPSRAISANVIPKQTTVNKSRSDKVNKLMGDYIQQMVIQTVLSDTADVIKLLISRQKIELFPQIAYQAIEQVTLQLFQLEDTKKILRDSYDDAYEKTMDLMDQKKEPSQIQIQVKSIIDGAVGSMLQKPIFRHIVQEVLKQAMIQNRKIVASQVMQRQAQLAMIQKQAEVMQKAIIQQYQNAVVQTQQRQQKMAMDQMQAQATQAQYNAMRQQYEQQLQVLQKDVQAQYDKAVLTSMGGN